MALFEPVAVITDSPLVSELQAHRPALQALRSRFIESGAFWFFGACAVLCIPYLSGSSDTRNPKPRSRKP